MDSKKISDLDKNEMDRAKELHDEAIFINILDATHLENWDNDFYSKLQKSGVTLDQVNVGGENFGDVVGSIMSFKEAVSNAGKGEIIIAQRTDDILKAKKEGKLAVFFGCQHGRVLDKNEKLLEILYNMDLRILGLCYNTRNNLADGCNEVTDAGLSCFGFKVVDECNKLGILLDASHVGHQSSLDMFEASKKPAVFTHSNAMAIHKNRRNIYDDQIKAASEKNGVIGITSFGPTVKQLTSNEDIPTLEDLLDHLDYYVNMIGSDHVGIGIDSDRKRSKEDVERQLHNLFDFNA
ncbi:membrane dipeptidase, partial [Thermoproteota archaeon]